MSDQRNKAFKKYLDDDQAQDANLTPDGWMISEHDVDKIIELALAEREKKLNDLPTLIADRMMLNYSKDQFSVFENLKNADIKALHTRLKNIVVTEIIGITKNLKCWALNNG